MPDDLSPAPDLSQAARPGFQLREFTVGQRYRCKQGHDWRAVGQFDVVSTVVGAPAVSSGPLCPFCYVEFHRAQFGAEKVP